MSGHLRLYKDGFKLWKYQEHEGLTQRKIEGNWCVFRTEDKQVLHTFATEKECSDWFHKDEEVECIFSSLRDYLEIVGDVTLGDFVQACRSIGLWEAMNVLAPGLYSEWPTGRIQDSWQNSVTGSIKAGLKGIVKDGILTIVSDVDYPPIGNAYEDMADQLLTVSDSFRIYHLEHPYPNAFKGSYSYSLLEVLSALGGRPEERVHTLAKDGVWEPEGVVKKKHPVQPFQALMYPIEVDDDLTLGDLFRVVEEDGKLSAFIAAYSWCWHIDEFHAQAKLPPETSDHEENIWYCYVNASLDTHEYQDEISADFGVDFFGEGELSEEEKEHWSHCQGTPPTSTKDGLSMSPMNTIAHLPLRVCQDFLVHGSHKIATGERSKKGRMKHQIKFVEHVRCQRHMTLLDILDAIYWDISFHGGPADNESVLEDLKSRVDSIKSEMRWHRRVLRKLKNIFLWGITFGRRKPRKLFYSVDDMLDELGCEDE